ncbi:MAG: hypothetical protein AAF567_16315 [Actinomycetota bacterium]
MWRTLVLTLSLFAFAALLASCGSSGDGPPAIDLSQGGLVESEPSNDADSATDRAATGDCPSEPFSGTVSRSADESSGHPEGSWDSSAFTAAKAVSIGPSSYTTYIGSGPIGGGTVTAEPGGVVVTMFVFGNGADLTPGATFDASPGPIIDNSGNAEATTTNGAGTVTIVAAGDSELCFDIVYADDFQSIDGRVSAPLG